MRYFFLVLLLLSLSCNYRHEKLGKETDSFSDISAENLTFTLLKDRIFKTKCFSCHTSGGSASHVPLETREDIVDSPLEIVIPGNPDESGIIIATTRTDNKRMPPPDSGISPLTAAEIDAIRQWIMNGAPE